MTLLPSRNYGFVQWTQIALASNEVLTSGKIVTALPQSKMMTSSNASDQSRTKQLRTRNDNSPIEFGSDSKKDGRFLLPHPPALPSPVSHGKHGNGSGAYVGCLGFSVEELADLWIFQGDIPPCAIYVNGTLVAGKDNGIGSFVGTSSGGYVGNVDGSGSGGSSGSGNGGNGGGSSSGTGGEGSGGGGSGGGGSGGGGSGGSGTGSGGSESNASGSNNGGSESGTTESEGSNGLEENMSTRDNGGAGDSSAYNSDNDENSGSDSSGSGGSEENSGNDDGSDDEDEQVSPLRHFNISDCGTYSNLWVWDLALSCKNATSFENCECTSASILFQYGEIECPGTLGYPSCPSTCPVCKTCMVLLGCPQEVFNNGQQVQLPNSVESSMTRALPVALGTVAALFTLGLFIYVVKHYYKPEHSKTNLQSKLITGGMML